MKTVYMTEDEYNKYELYAAGVGLIQEMLPEIDKCDRELLKSGICGDCWKNMFGPAHGNRMKMAKTTMKKITNER